MWAELKAHVPLKHNTTHGHQISTANDDTYEIATTSIGMKVTNVSKT